MQTGSTPSVGNLLGKTVVISVGDMAVCNDEHTTLATYALGTCVGVVLYDPKKHVAGMLHLMLPDSTLSPEKAEARPSMFADSGVPALLNSVQALGAKSESLKVVIAGGASTLSESDFFKIGERNVQTVKQILEENNINVDLEVIGGISNRTLHFKGGTVTVKTPEETQTHTL